MKTPCTLYISVHASAREKSENALSDPVEWVGALVGDIARKGEAMRKLLLGLAGAIPAAFLSMAADAQQGCGPRGADPSWPEYVVITPSKATDGSVAVQENVSTTIIVHYGEYN